jgi:hypothetical protein
MLDIQFSSASMLVNRLAMLLSNVGRAMSGGRWRRRRGSDDLLDGNRWW